MHVPFGTVSSRSTEPLTRTYFRDTFGKWSIGSVVTRSIIRSFLTTPGIAYRVSPNPQRPFSTLPPSWRPEITFRVRDRGWKSVFYVIPFMSLTLVYASKGAPLNSIPVRLWAQLFLSISWKLAQNHGDLETVSSLVRFLSYLSVADESSF